ncbi:MAG: hypothetical protein M9947_08975 [Thermomicrobiales bacterium]|nr:hypothetical protein [Thermomicrobiales bacterium]
MATNRRNLFSAALLGLAGAALVSESVTASDATPTNDSADRTSSQPVVERLFQDVPGMLDDRGRFPLLQLTFEAGAALPADMLVVPYTAFVDAGQLDVTIDQDNVVLGANGRFTVAEGETSAITNSGAIPAILFVLPQFDDINDPQILRDALPTSNVCLDCLPAGLNNVHVSNWVDPIWSLAPGRFTVDRVTLPPGTSLDSVDLGAETDARSITLVIEGGSIAFGSETLSTGTDNVQLKVTDPFDEHQLQTVGDGPAQLVLLREGTHPDFDQRITR